MGYEDKKGECGRVVIVLKEVLNLAKVDVCAKCGSQSQGRLTTTKEIGTKVKQEHEIKRQ